MKYLKYITMVLLVAVFAACGDKEVTYMTEPVDEATTAYVQVYWEVPLANVVANRVYKIQLNDVVYQNNGAAMMNPFGNYPSASYYYTVPAGEVKIVLYDNKDKVLYESTINVVAGQRNNIYVYQLDKAPLVVHRGDIPVFAGSDSTVRKANLRFVNLMFEQSGMPTADKLQVYMQNSETKEYDIPMGSPVGFGEVSEWMVVPLVWNFSDIVAGSQSKYYKIKVFGADGTDKGFLQYINAKGKETEFSENTTMYAGRSSKWVLHGIRTSKASGEVVAVAGYYYE